MATLIYAANSSGCTGKCDANCYEATSSHCECICGGANHGVGLKQATANTQKHAEEWIEKYASEKKVDAKMIKVNQEIFQLKLF